MAFSCFTSKATGTENKMVKAVFIDRDGTLNKMVQRGEEFFPPWTVDEFEFCDDAQNAISNINKLGFWSVLVTNQPDVDEGKTTEGVLDYINQKMLNIGINYIKNARTRGAYDYKPNTGMIDDVVNQLSIDRNKSFMIGDSWKDVLCGLRSGLTTIYIGIEFICPDKYKVIYPHHMVSNVFEASLLIKELTQYD